MSGPGNSKPAVQSLLCLTSCLRLAGRLAKQAEQHRQAREAQELQIAQLQEQLWDTGQEVLALAASLVSCDAGRLKKGQKAGQAHCACSYPGLIGILADVCSALILQC